MVFAQFGICPDTRRYTSGGFVLVLAVVDTEAEDNRSGQNHRNEDDGQAGGKGVR